MANYSVPGVYVEEISSFPASVAPVETALPVFIGRTRRTPAENPLRIGSYLEFAEHFGAVGGLTVSSLQLSDTGQFLGADISLDRYLDAALRLFYAGEERPAFADRGAAYFERLLPVYPFLGQWAWTVDTRNTFPHGAGIASSASAFAALALCLVAVERRWFGGADDAAARRKASYLARLGSGSAARSVFPVAAAWGQSKALEGSSDAYAVPVAERMHAAFAEYRDTIVLVNEAEKAVSSSAGHGLMDQQPYASTRYQIAGRRFERLLDILRRGELEDFCTLVEADALDLHALMMQSHPPFLLMEPATVAVIKAVRAFRAASGVPVCFTLDAGPNVHVLYPAREQERVDAWLADEVLPLVPGGSRILDHVA